MSLTGIPYNEQPPAGDVIHNNGFWPDIEPKQFRDYERVLPDITTSRVEHALRTGISDINRQLRHWQQSQQNDGAKTLEDVPPPDWQAPDGMAALYCRAVYATAMATLLERYRNYSATDAGKERGEEKTLAADDYRRDARWAVAELQDDNHCIVDLL